MAKTTIQYKIQDQNNPADLTNLNSTSNQDHDKDKSQDKTKTKT